MSTCTQNFSGLIGGLDSFCFVSMERGKIVTLYTKYEEWNPGNIFKRVFYYIIKYVIGM